jgi:hypothetical protein
MRLNLKALPDDLTAPSTERTTAMPHTAEMLAETPPELFHFYYRPRVELEYPDASIAIGNYRFLIFSEGMRSIGAIGYKHLLGVVDADTNDPFYVAAETNDGEGDSVVYLGTFNPDQHTTITRSPLLAHAGFFIPIACMVARHALKLDYADYPLTPAEDTALGLIPGLMQQVFPDGNIDENTLTLIRQLRECVLSSP